MIRIQNLYLKDFMSINEADLDFNKHINFIVGDPGTGKSAIFEAINICLSDEKRSKAYSEYVQQGKDQAIIKLKCLINNKEANFDVKLNCVHGAAFEGELTYDGKTYKGSSKISEFLKGLELDYYLRIMFSMQNKKNIVDLSPAERLERLQKLFDCDFSEQKDDISKKLKEVKEKSSKILEEKNKNLVLVNELKTPEEVRKNIISQEQYVGTLKKIDTKKDELSNIKSKITESEVASKECSIIELKLDEAKRGKTQIVELEKQIEKTKSEITEKEKLLDQILTEKEKNTNKVNDFNNSIEFNEEEKRKAEGRIQSLELQIHDATYKLNDSKDKKALIDKGVCPHCGQPTHDLFPNIDGQISELENQIKEKQENVQKIRTEITEFAGVLTQLKSDRDKVQSHLNEDKTAEKMTIDSKNRLLDNIKGYEATLFEFKTMDLDKKIEDLSNKLDEAKKKIVDSSSLITQSKTIEEELSQWQALVREYDIIEESNKQIEKRNAERLERAKVLSQRIEEIDKENLTLQSEIDAYTEAYVFFNKVFPQYISKKTSEVLTSNINGFIHNVFPNFDVKLVNTEKGCELQYTKDRTLTDTKRNDKLNSKMSSGFERDVLDLSFKVSLAQSFKLDLFIGDEVDGACGDKFAIELIKEVLNKENFKQIFIISHKPNLVKEISEIFEDCNTYETNSGTFKKRDF